MKPYHTQYQVMAASDERLLWIAGRGAELSIQWPMYWSREVLSLTFGLLSLLWGSRCLSQIMSSKFTPLSAHPQLNWKLLRRNCAWNSCYKPSFEHRQSCVLDQACLLLGWRWPLGGYLNISLQWVFLSVKITWDILLLYVINNNNHST